MIIANRSTHGVLHRWHSNRSMGYAYYKVWPTFQETPRPKFIASVAPTKSTEETGSREVTLAVHNGRGTGINATGEVQHNRETAMCGRCAQPFSAHSDSCDRDIDQPFGTGYEESHDYFQYGPIDYNRRPVAHIVPYFDTQGYPEDEDSEEVYRDNEWDAIHQGNSDFSTEDLQWRDKEPRECTSVLPGATGYHFKNWDNFFNKDSFDEGHVPTVTMRDGSVQEMYVDTSAIEAQQRTVYVEGIDGYHSIKLLDLLITAKSHAKMLNVYKQMQRINGEDKNVLRIGGLTLIPSFEKEDPEFGDLTWTSVTATCNHHGCRYQDARKNWRNAQFTIQGYEITRSQMEDFVYSLIRHGNNHAAPWFHQRVIARASHRVLESIQITPHGEDNHYSVVSQSPWRIEIPKDTHTFYKVHERTCALDCNPTAVNCG